MSYETDHTDYNPYAKKVYTIIENKWKRLREIAYDVDSGSRVSNGVEAFRLERVSIIKELTKYIGQEEADIFSKLPTKLLLIHPSQLAQNYMFRDFSKNEVDSHASFLWELMRRVKAGSIEYNGTDINIKREVILRELYKFKDSETPYKSLDYLIDLTGFELHEIYWILEDLKAQNKLREANFEFAISPIGAKEVERTMAETYAEKAFRVLKTIHETKNKESNGWVNIWDLQKELPDISSHELNMILGDLEKRKGLIDSNDQAVWMIGPGIEELEQAQRHPERSTPNFPAYINNYTVNIHGDNQGNIAQASQGNNQSVINHQPISEILPKLAELIEAVKQAEFEDRDEVVRDLEKVQQLAQSQDPKSKWALIQSKLSSAKTGMELVGYGYSSLPYWPVIWQYFFG
jgi:hypothetical protein